MREEDPYTGAWTNIVPSSVVVHRSRFEVDLNRPRERAIYQKPEDAWGLNVWKSPLKKEAVEHGLMVYDHFYDQMELLFEQIQEQWGKFVVLDLHSYNFRPNGPTDLEQPKELNPDINIGTGTMDREYWSPLVDNFISGLRQFNFFGRQLDVRENMKSQGGEFGRWAHKEFPETACVISINVKKFFMNEWTGQVDHSYLEMIRAVLASTIPGLERDIAKMRAKQIAA